MVAAVRAAPSPYLRPAARRRARHEQGPHPRRVPAGAPGQDRDEAADRGRKCTGRAARRNPRVRGGSAKAVGPAGGERARGSTSPRSSFATCARKRQRTPTSQPSSVRATQGPPPTPKIARSSRYFFVKASSRSTRGGFFFGSPAPGGSALPRDPSGDAAFKQIGPSPTSAIRYWPPD